MKFIRFPKTSLKPAYHLPITGIALLSLFIALPTIAYIFEWNTFNNWFLYTEMYWGKNLLTLISISFFIYLAVDLLLVEYLLRKVPALITKETDISKKVIKLRVKKYQSRQVMYSFAVFLIFIIQLLLLNKEAANEQSYLSTVTYLSISCVVFYFITQLKNLIVSFVEFTSSSINTVNISDLSLKKYQRVGIVIFERFLAFIEEVKNCIPSFNNSRTFIERSYDSTWKALEEKNSLKVNLSKQLYTYCAISAWIFTFICAALAIVSLWRTNPSYSFHNGFSVLFFIILLTIVGILLIKLLRNLPIVYGLICDIGSTLIRLFKRAVEAVVKNKILSVVTFVIVMVIWYFYANSIHQNTTDKLNVIELSKQNYKFSSAAPSSNSLKSSSANTECATTDKRQRPLVLIATAGGGIAASAWTAEILNSLEKRDAEECPENALSKNIAAISSVSGGSLGAYYFIAKQKLIQKCVEKATELMGKELTSACISETNKLLTNAHSTPPELASRSSLGSIAWGFSVYELQHYTKLRDSGREQALENRWSSIYCREMPNEEATSESDTDEEQASRLIKSLNLCSEYQQILTQSLEEWRTTNQNVPDFLINATLQEQGKRIVFSNNTAFTSETGHTSNENSRIHNLSTSDGELRTAKCSSKVPVVRAVRYSATFPYVTPATKLNPQIECDAGSMHEMHLIDGGYVDNSGIQTLLDYIKFHDVKYEGELSRELNPRPIIIVQIDAYKYESSTSTKRSPFMHELLSPISGIMNIRKSQRHANEYDIKRLADDFGYQIEPVISLQFGGTALPLSWHLSKSESKSISAELNEFKQATQTTIQEKSCDTFRDSDKNMISGSLGYQLHCLQYFWDRTQITIDPPPPDDDHEKLKELVSDIPQQTSDLLAANKTSLYSKFIANQKVLSNAFNLFSTLSNETVQNENIISLLGELIGRIDHLDAQSIYKPVEPIWMERARTLACSDSEDPVLVATSPPFHKGLPSVNGSWQNINKLATCGPKSCSDEEIYDENFSDANKDDDDIHQQTFVVGVASAKDKPKNNFNLAERRAIWLLNRMNNKQRFKSIRSISWGEMIPLEHPRLKAFGDQIKPPQTHQFAFAFQCIPSV